MRFFQDLLSVVAKVERDGLMSRVQSGKIDRACTQL
jgi:hypothetical protein